MLTRLLCLSLLTLTSLYAELRVDTDFEGGNAEVVTLDQASQKLRLMPALHEGRGWPCWWFFKLHGLTPGTELTLEVQAQTKPYREQTVLAAAWCQPKHAWLSRDGTTWTPSDEGQRTDGVMVYHIKASAETMSFAWGPPFVPTDADKLLAEIAAKVPGSQRFELAHTKNNRPVNGIRIGAEDAKQQFWVNARHHAWEAGGSWVGVGFIRWYASDDTQAVALRAKSCLHYIPIMDVDNAALGAGGKDAVPRDHNRDWADQPLYPEVAAAQQRLREIESKHGLTVYLDLHNPGASDPIFFFGPFQFERQTGEQRANYQRWMDLAAATIQKPRAVEPKYRFATYVTTDEERGRMSSEWVRQHTSEKTLSVTLETGWNSPLMSATGYQEIGANLGRTLAKYCGVE